MLSDIVMGLFPVGLLSVIFIGYFAVKNNWKIVDWF